MTDQPCLFVPPHEPFYCRIHADVRLSLNDERCGKARLVASRGEPADTLRDILGRMHVGPLHPADRSWLTEHGLHALDDIIGAFTQLAAAHRECRSPSTGDDRLREALEQAEADLPEEAAQWYGKYEAGWKAGARWALARIRAATPAPKPSCIYVGCTTAEPHEHGGGRPMREMTPEYRAATPAPKPENPNG
jgi:hypothetical protein